MKLNCLAENSPQDVVKQGQKMAQSELHGHTSDPAGLYSHIVKGLTHTNGLIVTDEKYWQQMFAYWPHVTPEQKNEIFEKIAGSVSKRLQNWQQTGQLQEGVMGAIGNAVGGAVNWVGRQITNFAQFIAKLKTILDAGQGRQAATPGQRQQQGMVYSKLNADSVIGFTDQCLLASQKSLEQRKKAEAAKSSVQPQQSESGPLPPPSAQNPSGPGIAGKDAAPAAGPAGSRAAPGTLALAPGRS